MEDFVTYEIAVKLKEKGFKEQCLAYYSKDSNFYYNTTLNSYVITGFKSFNSNPNGICWKRIDAPTISQVLKWLREEHKYNINMRLYIEYGWYYTVQDCKGEFIYSQLVNTDVLYHSYEESALAGIEYALDNLI